MRWPAPNPSRVEVCGCTGRAKLPPSSLKQWRDGARPDMLQINADQVFTIGTVSGVPQPVVVSKRLRNVPKESIYSWDPGAHFGVYRPDCFWFSHSTETAAVD